MLTGHTLNKTRLDKGDYLIAVNLHERVDRAVDKERRTLLQVRERGHELRQRNGTTPRRASPRRDGGYIGA